MKNRLFPLLIALSALAVSGSAAFYSVFGLSKLFAGASTQVIIMAGSLEFAKLVVASLLYQYWDTINKFLRFYLGVACFVLMVITSGGIYGFLSGAYQSTATQSELLDKSLMILNQKQVRFQETKEDLTLEKTQINKSISDLRISLSNPQQVSWYDKNSETVITSTSGSARRALQAELKTTIVDRDNINIKIEAVMDSINKTDITLLDKEISNEAESELGPLKYLAETTGYPMNQVVNWFLLLIIFVFDPLAIALVVAANMAFAQIRKPEIGFDLDNPQPPNDKLKKDVKKYKEEETENLTYPQFVDKHYPKTQIDIPTHDPQTGELNPYYKELTGEENPLEEFDNIPEGIKNKEDELMLEAEKRMNIIGQNGNDGLHYDERYLEELNRSFNRELSEEETIKEIVEAFQEDDEIDEWMNQLGKSKEEELEKSKEALSIMYNDEDVPFDRITDTTKTFVDNINVNNELDDEGKTLRYKGR